MIYNRKFTKELQKDFAINFVPAFDPGKDSFLYKAFSENMAEARGSLNSVYLQGIKNAALNPNQYGAFIMQDIFYCTEGVKSLEIAVERSKDFPQLHQVMTYVHKFYKDYVEDVFVGFWGVKNAESIRVRPVLEEYSAHERAVAEKEHPIYMLIALLPCYYLWTWLADQLKEYQENNIYGQWIAENLDTKPSELLYHTIEEYRKSNSSEFDENKALLFFGRSMVYERRNFEDAAN